ncbi:MAG: ribonuclease BN [Zunongwangia sp.]|uniref:YihY/virulence factor BrkB family protein n=1 Tax=unclassified Microbacterium TaxID=2609290 RepID=UPI000C5921D3|nr:MULTISPECIES: YihY/virulence factor BrkB family protein [unclassified Microbacterium]MAO34618.1 ribonuclease BN [Zunongwangia sp.]MAY48768.1 ribonuclease BN [Microbacterium sp.]HAS33524.1 ribonuclease BN [Microbacterium sp.]HBS75844.1 ribonuclease BN [Microbacterium sp.]|tara:strand:- start:135080 stop:136090 length:1011 start_codon:yes stop_codon:yes gene_type:complete
MKAFVARAIRWMLTLKLVRALLLYSERRGPQLADSITYRTLFSVFAGVLLGFSFAALWLSGNPDAYQALVGAVNQAIPGLIGTDGEGLIDADAIQAPAGLSITGAIATVGLVGAAIGAIGSLRLAIRSIADRTTDDLMFVWVLLRNLGLAIGIGAGLVASAAATILGTAGVGIVTDWLGRPDEGPLEVLLTRLVTIVAVFALDALVVAAAFFLLSGVKPSGRALWSGALLGAVGLTVLQQLSGLFVGGASSNPLLASFASLIALLLWINLSAQVILIASAYIVTGVEEDRDRVRAKYGASTFAQRRVQRAERSVQTAVGELEAAREAERAEREENA